MEERWVVLEPGVKGDGPALPPPLPCANCGTLLAGPYCSRCGQHVADYHRSVWRLVVDFMDNVFAWDSRLFRTLKPLFTRPGFLTQEFMEGRRVRYVHPLRLFLFTSAVCLAFLHFGGISVAVDKHSKSRDRQVKRATAEAAAAEPTVAPIATPFPDASASPPSDPKDDLGALINEAVKGKVDEAQSRHLQQVGGKIGETFEKKIKDKGGLSQFNKDFTEGIRRRLSWVALGMLPLFAVMLRAIYWRKDTFYFQHLIFSLHYHTFVLLFWTAYSWLGLVLEHIPWLQSLTAFLFLAVPAYLFLALSQVYGDSVRRTVIKSFLLGGMHLLAIIAGLATIGALSFFTAL